MILSTKATDDLTIATVNYTGGTVGALFDDIKHEQARKGTKSRIAEIMDSLSVEDRKDFKKALDDHSIPASNISKAMEKRGFKLAVNVISRYRRGELTTEIK